MVWPIMPGRIVDRRDHVLITFFSLRAFMPATLICRWLSMNGPFLSERPIVSPYPVNSWLSYSSTRRHLTHCARRNFRNPRTGPGTRCDTGQNGHTNLAPCAFGVFSTATAHPGLQSRYNTCTGTAAVKRLAVFAGLAAGRVVRAGLRVRP